MLDITSLPFMKKLFSEITMKKAAIVVIVAAFFVVSCFFLGIYFYAKYLENQLQNGIEIGEVVLSAEQAEISLLHGTADIKNLYIHNIEHEKEHFFSIGKITISGIPVSSFARSDTLLLAKKVTLTEIEGKYRKNNVSTAIALKGISVGEVWGSPSLLLSDDPKDTFSALLSLSLRDAWFFTFTGERIFLQTSDTSVTSIKNKTLGEEQEKSTAFAKNQKNDLRANVNTIRSSSTFFEKRNAHSQSNRLSDSLIFELMQKLGSHSSWSMEFAKVDFFSLTHLENASFSNIHVLSEKEEVASLALAGIQQAEYSAIGLGLPFSNLKELTLTRLRFPNKKEGDITLANAGINASLLFNGGVSLELSLHELSLPKKVSPLSFQNTHRTDAQEENARSDTPSLNSKINNSFGSHVFDTSFRGTLSLAYKQNQEDILCVWQADSFEFHLTKFWTLSGKGSGLLRDTVNSFVQVDFLDAKLSDTLGGVIHRTVKNTVNLDEKLFYWLLMGSATSEVYLEN